MALQAFLFDDRFMLTARDIAAVSQCCQGFLAACRSLGRVGARGRCLAGWERMAVALFHDWRNVHYVPASDVNLAMWDVDRSYDYEWSYIASGHITLWRLGLIGPSRLVLAQHHLLALI